MAFEKMGTDLHAHTTGDFAHRSEKGKRTVGQLHRLIRNRRDVARKKRVGDVRIRGKVQVGEENEARTEILEFGCEWLLHFADEIRALPNLCSCVNDGRAGTNVVLIGDRRVAASAALNENCCSRVEKFTNSIGGDGDSMLFLLDLAWHSNGERGRRGVHANATGVPAAARMSIASTSAIRTMRSISSNSA